MRLIQSSNLEKPPNNICDADAWILAEFSEINGAVKSAWERIDIYSAAQLIKNFSTGIFPSHWLEMAKTRLYDGDENAAWVIHRIVRDLLIIFSPICPFFTHYLSTTLYSKSAVDERDYPSIPVEELGSTDRGKTLRKMSQFLISFNGDVWKAKKDANLSLNSPISGVTIPSEIELLKDALTKMHKLE